MYCTGGIRCDIYSTVLKKHGFENLYTLEGGVQKYFKEKGDELWEGSLFVFDGRMAIRPESTSRPFCDGSQRTIFSDGWIKRATSFDPMRNLRRFRKGPTRELRQCGLQSTFYRLRLLQDSFQRMLLRRLYGSAASFKTAFRKRWSLWKVWNLRHEPIQKVKRFVL